MLVAVEVERMDFKLVLVHPEAVLEVHMNLIVQAQIEDIQVIMEQAVAVAAQLTEVLELV
jgi:hypothetical protein